MAKNEYNFIKGTEGNVNMNLGGNSRMEMSFGSKDKGSSISAGRDVDIRVGGNFNMGSQRHQNDFRGAAIGSVHHGATHSTLSGCTTYIGGAGRSNLPEANPPSVSENRTIPDSNPEQSFSERIINLKVRLLTLKRMIHLRLPDSSLIQSVADKIKNDEGVDVELRVKSNDGSDKTLDPKKRLREENVADGSILFAHDIAITGASSNTSGRRVVA